MLQLLRYAILNDSDFRIAHQCPDFLVGARRQLDANIMPGQRRKIQFDACPFGLFIQTGNEDSLKRRLPLYPGKYAEFHLGCSITRPFRVNTYFGDKTAAPRDWYMIETQPLSCINPGFVMRWRLSIRAINANYLFVWSIYSKDSAAISISRNTGPAA
ncbi:hypothetical protein BRL93_20525 [Xanthomonas oryzae pv. oryzae]|nr:hypothetical protein BRL93_20525 [Xanthomonas oryzae pv. oryzae]